MNQIKKVKFYDKKNLTVCPVRLSQCERPVLNAAQWEILVNDLTLSNPS